MYDKTFFFFFRCQGTAVLRPERSIRVNKNNKLLGFSLYLVYYDILLGTDGVGAFRLVERGSSFWSCPVFGLRYRSPLWPRI